MTRFPKKNKGSSSLETIPHELVTEILSRVAASSIADLHSVKLSCKNLREVAEDEHVYHHACLDKIPIVPWKPLSEKQRSFLNKCRESSNPESLYREAVIDYFNKTKFTTACQKLDKALKLGHVGAMYVKSVVLLLSNDDELKRKGMKLIGEMKKSRLWERKVRLCREKLLEELRHMWVMNPVLKEKQPKYCTAHQRKVQWSDEGDDDDECEACSADKEVKLISPSYTFNY